MTETYFGSSTNQIAHAVSLDTNHANPFVFDAVEKFCPPVDHHVMHDVFIVTSEGSGGRHIMRTVYAADEDDARHAHQENYVDETIVAVHQ